MMPALGGGVVLAARRALDGGQRGRADQHAAAAPLHHVPRRRAEREEGAVEIDLQHAAAIPRSLISRNDADAAAAHAGIGEAAIDASELAQGLGEGRLDGLFIGDVALQRQHLAARWLCQLCFRGGILGRRWCPRWRRRRRPRPRVAMPRPMPLLPPVTSATLPVRSKGLYMACTRCGGRNAGRKSCAFHSPGQAPRCSKNKRQRSSRCLCVSCDGVSARACAPCAPSWSPGSACCGARA